MAFATIGVPDLIDVDGLVSHAAAGMEIDRSDPDLGTPPHAVTVAEATGFSDHFQLAIEDVLTSNSRQGGTVEPLVRADMVFVEYPGGGAVFSTSSIAWVTCLVVDNFVNPVATLTGNVVRRFLDPEPFTDPEPTDDLRSREATP